MEPHYNVDGGYQEPRRPLMQGFYQAIDRVKERYAIAKTEDQVAQIGQGEAHDDHDDHDDHHDDHHDEQHALEHKH